MRDFLYLMDPARSAKAGSLGRANRSLATQLEQIFLHYLRILLCTQPTTEERGYHENSGTWEDCPTLSTGAYL
mgnify:CR=1 FL=1